MDDSLIPDDLLRQLIAVGQVDLLVGVSTLDHAALAADLARAVRTAFRTYFPRLRTALLTIDRGSADGTPEALEHAWRDGVGPAAAWSALRTTHYISSPASVLVGGVDATRRILGAADLLQATAVVVLDADAEITPDWIAGLAAPLRDGEVDLVAPVYRRHAAEGLLVTQLVRPLVWALLGRRLHEPLLNEFGASGLLAAQCTQAAWAAAPAQLASHVWIGGVALTGPFAVRQTDLGARRLVPGRARPPLTELFQQVVGSTFATLDDRAEAWLPQTGSEEVPLAGTVRDAVDPGPAPAHDAGRLLATFAHDVETLAEILRGLLAPDTFAAIVAASRDPEQPGIDDALWAATVADFVLAYHHNVIRRDHVTQALLPLYMARTGTFLARHGQDPPAPLEAACAALAGRFEQMRSRVVERWLQPA